MIRDLPCKLDERQNSALTCEKCPADGGSNGCVHIQIDLGRTSVLSDRRQYWLIRATGITGRFGDFVSFTDARGRVVSAEDFGLDVVRAPNGLLRQNLTATRLADIVAEDDYTHTITVYPFAEAKCSFRMVSDQTYDGGCRHLKKPIRNWVGELRTFGKSLTWARR